MAGEAKNDNTRIFHFIDEFASALEAQRACTDRVQREQDDLVPSPFPPGGQTHC